MSLTLLGGVAIIQTTGTSYIRRYSLFFLGSLALPTLSLILKTASLQLLLSDYLGMAFGLTFAYALSTILKSKRVYASILYIILLALGYSTWQYSFFWNGIASLLMISPGYYILQTFYGIVPIHLILYFFTLILFFYRKHMSQFLNITVRLFIILLMLFVANLALISLAISPLFVDLSTHQGYALPKYAQKLLQSIQSPVTLTMYEGHNSRDTAERAVFVQNKIQLLHSYKKDSTVSKITIDSTKKGKEDAKKLGLELVSAGALGLILQSGGHHYVFPYISTAASFDYDVTSALSIISRESKPNITLYDFPQANSSKSLYAPFRSVLLQQFVITDTTVYDAQGTFAPKGSVAILYIKNNEPFPKNVLPKINSYIEKGGMVIMIFDITAVVAAKEGLVTTPALHNLETWLGTYGITTEKGLIASLHAQTVTYQNEKGSLKAKYPYAIATSNFTRTGPLTNIDDLEYSWVSPLGVSDMLPKNLQASVLVSSEADSWIDTKKGLLTPLNSTLVTQKSMKSYPIIISVADKKTGGTLLTVPSTHSLQQPFLSKSADNYFFMANIINHQLYKDAYQHVKEGSDVVSDDEYLTFLQRTLIVLSLTCWYLFFFLKKVSY